ncbi:hypothetical protein PAAG_08165 [Paracoccidioides lutzii Pb01]|uniref:Uncharacterized protein n=1 Tax=Paracoccidioides lutzii (strain ATCC MYA-826 / Pb01) TaxID=502779 RepID=C1HBM4_PARBA|nr:hypothetical protein PAAG_08165 [Paracoccidioides lutzii Pb01]EEH38438.1 hypothetical protein PAAG_08165 [Paracoccidioides lutzii Pb01]
MPSATSVLSATPCLSSNDSAVLQALFDAESSPANASNGIHLDPSLPQQLPGISASDLSKLQTEELAAIKPLQQGQEQRQDSDPAANAEAIRTAVSQLTAIIDKNPQYPSAYINRAQAMRMLVESSSPQNMENADSLGSQIFSDLSTAISLLTPSSSSSSSPASSTISLSPLHSRILANAHTHRAYILYRAARSLASSSASAPTSTAPPPPPSPQIDNLCFLPQQLRNKSAQHLEEMASMDFQLGGRYGNDVAKQMAVKTNPYAKICAAVVGEAMRKEMERWEENGAFVV